MTIIFFHGLRSSKKKLNYVYHDGKYHANNFIKLLKKIDRVMIPHIPYTDVYYYCADKVTRSMYSPITHINYQDLSIDRYIANLSIDRKKYPPPYIVMGHSNGIYFACQFARQYKKDVKCIISLDGSWIVKRLNKLRAMGWKEKGKIIPKINNQKSLDHIIDMIKLRKDNRYIDMMFDYIRSQHVRHCNEQKYYKINIPFITFRNFNSNSNQENFKYSNNVHNNNVWQEIDRLNRFKNHVVYRLLDATHTVWMDEKHKNTIIQTLKWICIL